MAEFADQFSEIFKTWKQISAYLICLAVKDLNELNGLTEVLDRKQIKYVEFFEPDVNQVTAIAIEPCEEADKVTSRIPLANKSAGSFDKHQV